MQKEVCQTQIILPFYIHLQKREAFGYPSRSVCFPLFGGDGVGCLCCFALFLSGCYFWALLNAPILFWTAESHRIIFSLPGGLHLFPIGPLQPRLLECQSSIPLQFLHHLLALGYMVASAPCRMPCRCRKDSPLSLPLSLALSFTVLDFILRFVIALLLLLWLLLSNTRSNQYCHPVLSVLFYIIFI